ncbi:MAG: HAD family hydrolase [Thermoplasmata archaeon]|nr:HAD family hydrolase [Thermoplasmata archaeon]
MLDAPSSWNSEIQRTPMVEPPPEPKAVARGVVIFDMDGTLIDSIGLISHVAADVLFRAFGTPPDEARIHYLATTGMPFEAQLAQLYPEIPVAERLGTARLFHHRKVLEAYAHVTPFPEMPRTLRKLSSAGWTLAISTGAEREMADLIMEREGLRYWFEDVLGSGQGTKREHLVEYQRRYPGARLFLVGDSRFDLEAATGTPGVVALARASQLHGWALSPDDLRRWGAAWADYSLEALPEVLEGLVGTKPPKTARKKARRAAPAARRRKG